MMADVWAAGRWWLALSALGAAALPLTLYLMGRLADRGYALARLLGLLLTSFFFWLLGCLGFLRNDLGGIILAGLLVVALSGWALSRLDISLRDWWRAQKRYALLVEITFALLFGLWAVVRAHNPAITATEKPMELAFLNSAGRSPAYPPLDPWLSGYAISYYYFGYVMTSVLARLAGVTEALAFNLAIAWLLAGTGVGALSLVYNLTATAGRNAQRLALGLGLAAAVALPLAGNLQIVLEEAHANGVGSAEFWAWLDIRDLDGPPTDNGFYGSSVGPRFWWWWRSSRVIREYTLAGQEEEGLAPIAEFPAFSFLLGDLHPHVLALPFAFLTLGLALNTYLTPIETDEDRRKWLAPLDPPRLILAAVIVGGLAFLNTWDVLIHLFILTAACSLARWRAAGEWRRAWLGHGLAVGGALAALAIVFYLPFYVGFRSQAGPPFLLPMLMRPTRLAQFLVMFGLPLWPIVWLLGSLTWRLRPAWRPLATTAAVVLAGLLLLMLALGVIVAANPSGSTAVTNLATQLNIALAPRSAESQPLSNLAWGFGAVGRLTPAILMARLQWPWLTLFLLGLIGLPVALLSRLRAHRLPTPDTPTTLPFVLLLVVTGALLTLGPEFVYLKDNFGVRLNTIFKFYYQAWVMFGVAGLAGLAVLRQTHRISAVIAGVGYSLLLLGALLFPLRGAVTRSAEYGQPATLDGLAAWQNASPDEFAAIQWLRQNAAGGSVILEAVGGQYSAYGRVSAATGLPTLLGWPGHESQWRGNTPEPALREPLVKTVYTQPGWEGLSELLGPYNIAYIYVGQLERATYGASGLDKFRQHLPVAFENSSVTIYQWAGQ